MHALNAYRFFMGSRERQRGVYDLLSLSIGAAIAIAFATAGLWQKRQEMLSQQMAAQGDVLADIGNSINGKYLSIYYSNLVNGTSIPGVANVYAPTMTELEAINVVPAGYSTTSAYGMPYVISLSKTPDDCVAPNCDIAGMVYIAGAITDPSTGSALPLDDGAVAIGGDGGYSDLVTPATISGPDGGWTQPNPMGNLASVLAMRVGYGSSGWSAYVRRDGSLPMEGHLNFKGTDGTLHNIDNAATVNAQNVVTEAGNGVQIGSSFLYGDGSNSAIRQSGALYVQNQAGTANADIGGVGNIHSSGTVSALSVVTAAGGNVKIGNSTYYGDASNSAIYQNGSLFLQHPDGSAADIAVVGNVNSTATVSAQFLQPNGVAALGGACASNGQIAKSGSGPLFCQSGVWKPLQPQFGLGYTTVLLGNNNAEAYCPAGQTVISGGGACQGGDLESSFWATDGGWYAKCSGGAVQVWAGCMSVN
jgi:hypothetical protein